MHTQAIEWQLTVQLEDGSFAVFWLDIEPSGLTRYYDERGDRAMRGLDGQAAAMHLMARLGHGDPTVREYRHRACEFSGEFRLPLALVARAHVASDMIEAGPRARSMRDDVSRAIRLHFLRQASATLAHHRLAEAHPLA